MTFCAQQAVFLAAVWTATTLGATSTIAATTNHDIIDRGSRSSGGFHTPENVNYTCGNTTSGSRLRNFFLFDLAPLNREIIAAELELNLGFYISADPTETYTLFDVTSPIEQVVGDIFNLAVYDDLGTGTVFGSHIAFNTQKNTLISIPLNADAVASINAAASGGGLWAIGGAVTSLDADNQTPESLFGITENVPFSQTRLVLTTIPAPGAFAMVGFGALSFKRSRRRWS